MKRIYDYHTGKMINESSNTSDKKHLNEGVSFGDIIENSRGVYRVSSNYNSKVLNLKKLVFSPSAKPIAIWEYKGNFSAKEIVKLCVDADIDYCYVSAKSLNGSILDVYDNENVVIIDDFTFGQSGAVEDLIFDVEELAKTSNSQIICVGNIESQNNEIFADDLASIFANFVLSTPEEEDETVNTYESVAEKFAKYRKLYESDDEDSSDEGSSDEGEDDDKGDEGSSDEGEGDDKGDEEGEDKDGEGDETEDVPMTAIILTVKKDDVDKCKEELIDAGIPEDAITDIEGEDDDENGKLKIDADYALELKDYLKGKGIDLEEKIGGEIVDDSAEDSEGEGDSDKDKDKEGEDKSSKEGDGEDGEIDFDSEFGDLFGDEE